MISYLSTADIAGWFGVQPRTVDKWCERYGNFPKPDAAIGRVNGWLPHRETEIRTWEAGRRGQGWRASSADHAAPDTGL